MHRSLCGIALEVRGFRAPTGKTLTMEDGLGWVGEYWHYGTSDYTVKEEYGGRLRNMPDFCYTMGENTDARFDLLEVVPGESGEDPTFKTLFESRSIYEGFVDFHSTSFELPYHYTGRDKDDPGPLHQYARAH